jgi:uncharacterized membrane protein YjjB (DUF3815 family)
VSSFGNLYARALGRPASVTIVPGLLLLVPGSVGFRSFALMLQDQTVVGLGTAFSMMLVAISWRSGCCSATLSAAPPARELTPSWHNSFAPRSPMPPPILAGLLILASRSPRR